MMTVTPLLMVNLLMVMPITITIITLIEKVTSRVEKIPILHALPVGGA